MAPRGQPPNRDAGPRRGPAQDPPASPACPTIRNPPAVRGISFRPLPGPDPVRVARATHGAWPLPSSPDRRSPPHVRRDPSPAVPQRARPVRPQRDRGRVTETDGRGVPPGRAAGDCARLIAGVRLPCPSAPTRLRCRPGTHGPFRQTGAASALPCDQWEYPGEVRESGARDPRNASQPMTALPVTCEGAGPESGPVCQKVAAGPAGSAPPGDSVPSSGDRTRG